MELSRKEYPGLLDTLKPSQAVAILNERVKRAGRINQEIAEWIQERRKVEEAYAQGLKKLARKQPPDESSDMGVFMAPWAKIVNATESMAISHQKFAQRVEVDVEQALKEFMPKSRETQALSTIQGNLAAIAKEIDVANDKAEKLKKKGAKASAEKVASANSEIETATSQWISQAPYVFESLQAVDEARLNYLRDVLTQLQTHELDRVEQIRTHAEDCLNALLNVEAADEIQTFAAKAPLSTPRLERQRSRTVTGGVGSPPPSIAPPDDRASQISGRSVPVQRTDSVPESRPEKRSGLRRLGTVLGRRKNISSSARGVSPDKRSGERYLSLDSSAPEIPPIPSMNTPRATTPVDPTSERTLSALQPTTASPPQSRDSYQLQTPGSIHDDTSTSNVAGAAAPSNSANGVPSLEPQPQPQPLLDRSLQSESPTVDSAPQQDQLPASRPPPVMLDPISQAELEAASAQNPIKLDIRSTPIKEEEDGAAEAAMANVASALRSQAGPARRNGTSRGRRDVRNTIFVPTSQFSDVATSESPMVPTFAKATRAPTLPTDEPIGSDAQSVRSSKSLSSVAGAKSVKHPEMTSPGFNSSVVEAVSASFSQGQVVKATITGEMALAYNAPDATASSEIEHVRLGNFHLLEKVAHNPAAVTPISDKAGEYAVKLNSLARAAVAFRYQVHLDDTNLAAHAPIILAPAWKIEPHQASVILHYSLNPAFVSSTSTKLTLHHVTFIIHLEGSRATACQSKPVGTFSKEKPLIYWQLGDVTLEAGAPASKLLARFSTETEAKPGSVEARWEITGDDMAGAGSRLGMSQLRTTSSADASATTTTGGGTQDDPFADESAPANANQSWNEVPVVRRFVSGAYNGR